MNDQKQRVTAINDELQRKGMPEHIRKRVLQHYLDSKTLAVMCRDDPNFLDICRIYKQEICKSALVEAGFTNFEGFVSHRNDPDDESEVWGYCYLVHHILRIMSIARQYEQPYDVSFDEYRIAYFVSHIMHRMFSETELNSIPEDVIDFVCRNRKLRHLKRYKENYINDPAVISYLQSRDFLGLIEMDPERADNELLRYVEEYFIPQRVLDTIAGEIVTSYPMQNANYSLEQLLYLVFNRAHANMDKMIHLARAQGKLSLVKLLQENRFSHRSR